MLTWIERGEVNRRTANQFYSMVQLANSHVRRLMNEKATHEQEMEQAKENFKTASMGILTQCKLPRLVALVLLVSGWWCFGNPEGK